MRVAVVLLNGRCTGGALLPSRDGVLRLGRAEAPTGAAVFLVDSEAPPPLIDEFRFSDTAAVVTAGFATTAVADVVLFLPPTTEERGRFVVVEEVVAGGGCCKVLLFP